VCGKLLIRSMLVLLFSFEVPLKIKKYSKKKKETKKEAKKARDNIEGALCVFSFLLCGGALSSIVYPRTSILPPLNDFSTFFLC
jgi:hypothetical protein